jgi:septum formation inhibitor MinC
MIDPWTTLSAASAIVAFVEFGIVIIDKTIEKRNSSSGAVKHVEALENMAAQFKKDARVLKGSPTTLAVDELSEDEVRLNKLVLECKQLSDRILASVASLHAGKSASTRKTVMAAFRSER